MYKQLKADVESLRADLDFINARRAQQGLRPIQLSFNFDSDTHPAPAEDAVPL